MIEVRPPVACFLCATDHGVFKDWPGPDVCEACWDELFLDGQKVTAIDVGNGEGPITVWMADGMTVTFKSIRVLREIVFQGMIAKEKQYCCR